MKDDLLYPLYISYLDYRLNYNDFGNKITKSMMSLLKLSKSFFLEFKDRYDEDELFHMKVIKIYKLETRNRKIEDLFNGID